MNAYHRVYIPQSNVARIIFIGIEGSRRGRDTGETAPGRHWGIA